MSKCKYCEEDVQWIDGRPYSLQNHFKVCRPDGRVKPVKETPGGFGADISDAEKQSLEAALAAATENK